MVALTVFRKKGVLTERKDKVFLEIEFYDKFSCIFIISRYLNYNKLISLIHAFWKFTKIKDYLLIYVFRYTVDFFCTI